MHTDCNQEEGVLVFPYFKSTLLALIQGNPEFPTEGSIDGSGVDDWIVGLGEGNSLFGRVPQII
jgi:hypothetical protein